MSFLGPVFWHDLVRIARRQRVTLFRVVYAALLLAALLLLYVEKLPSAELFGGGIIHRREQLAEFANAFFAAFVAVQFAAVILFTPALAANALAEERSKNTLMFLFTTHLTNHEIVAGKLLTRLLQVGLLVLTGLPILALMQFFGGIDPNLVLASFLAVALTGVTLGCIGLVCGIRAKKPQHASWRAYQLVLFYAAASALSIWFFDLPLGRGTGWFWAMGPGGRGIVTPTVGFTPPSAPGWWQICIEAFNWGNPYFAYLRMYYEQARGTPFIDSLLIGLRDFAIFHICIAVLFGGYAIWRLRAIAARQSAGLKPTKYKYLKPAPHPPIHDRPMLWKEIYCESKPRQRWLALFFSRWFFFISFLPAWVIFLLVLDNVAGRGGFTNLSEYTILFLRLAGTLVACLLCIRVALQAARSIAAERERETLDSLLTTALTPNEIVAGKWWGAFLNCRWILLWLLVHWGLGVLVLSMTWYSVPLLLIEVLIFAAFSVGVGMVCAVVFPSSKQAMTIALLTLLLGTTLAPWIGCKVMAIATNDSWPRPVARPWNMGYGSSVPWTDQLAIALSPPRALAESVVRSEYLYYLYQPNDRFAEFFGYLVYGQVIYLGASVILAVTAARIFRAKVRGRSSAPQAPTALQLGRYPTRAREPTPL
jgi:ABC-type transport system involved in multi-copper enzyme maturation permease subunit